MRSSFFLPILFGALWCAFPATAVPQNPRQSGARTAAAPDLSGVWHPLPKPNGRAFGTEEPSMLPWAVEIYARNRRGLTEPNEKGLDQYDPNYNCYPPGPTRNIGRPFPFEIRQFPDVVFLLLETGHWMRRFYVDGRGHPDGFPVTWMGHSIGKYQDGRLVVDTISVHDESWIDGLGHPHSEALHLVEGWRRLNQETLEYEVTFDDPETFTKPWGGKLLFELQQPPYDQILEDVTCEHLLQMGKKWPDGVGQE